MLAVNLDKSETNNKLLPKSKSLCLKHSYESPDMSAAFASLGGQIQGVKHLTGKTATGSVLL